MVGLDRNMVKARKGFGSELYWDDMLGWDGGVFGGPPVSTAVNIARVFAAASRAFSSRSLVAELWSRAIRVFV